MFSAVLIGLAVGIVWGVTNAFMRTGVLLAERKRTRTAASDDQRWQRLSRTHWGALLTTPLFCVAQLVNWLGSALLVLSLATSDLHVVNPIANAVSLAANAAVSHWVLKDRLHLPTLVPGLACIAVGTCLCAL